MIKKTGDKEVKYSTRVIEEISHGKDCWNTLRVGVFEDERQIGEYERNYHTLYNTFFPFEQEGEWYALYSRKYTATRLMKLPSCEDIGGEEPSGAGFCPVDYHVPKYALGEMKTENKRIVIEYTEREALNVDKSKLISGILYRPFGFVAGCVWGDDSSWKIQFLDLTKAREGILERKEMFGYIEMPERAKRLSDCVRVEGDEPGEPVQITIDCSKHWWVNDDLELEED